VGHFFIVSFGVCVYFVRSLVLPLFISFVRYVVLSLFSYIVSFVSFVFPYLLCATVFVSALVYLMFVHYMFADVYFGCFF